MQIFQNPTSLPSFISLDIHPRLHANLSNPIFVYYLSYMISFRLLAIMLHKAYRANLNYLTIGEFSRFKQNQARGFSSPFDDFFNFDLHGGQKADCRISFIEVMIQGLPWVLTDQLLILCKKIIGWRIKHLVYNNKVCLISFGTSKGRGYLENGWWFWSLLDLRFFLIKIRFQTEQCIYIPEDSFRVNGFWAGIGTKKGEQIHSSGFGKFS